MKKQIAINSIIQSHEVEIDTKGKTVSFDFPINVDIGEIYGVGFSVKSNDRELGTLVGLDVGNTPVLNRSGRQSVEVEAFAFNHTKTLEETFLPVSIQNNGQNVRGEILDGNLNASFQPYAISIYLIGLRKA